MARKRTGFVQTRAVPFGNWLAMRNPERPDLRLRCEALFLLMLHIGALTASIF